MAWQFPTSVSKTDGSIAVDLLTTDSVVVASGILVASNGYAVHGGGVGQAVEIYGTVLSSSYAVWLGASTSTVNSNSVYVGEGGRVETKASFTQAIALWGGGNSLVNDGFIKGVYTWENTVTDPNRIENHGIIKNEYGVWADGFGGVTQLINSGTIIGSSGSYGGSNTSGTKDIITNKGMMTGQIDLRDGDDIYHGEKGTVKGAILGGGGSDQIYGGKENNIIDGGGGTDRLCGGKGADKLTGGTEADIFIFKALPDSTPKAAGRDTIMDFDRTENDTIDLHKIDANSTLKGNQDFHFIGSQDFHHQAGELRFEKTGGDTYVYADVDGNGKADFAIKIAGLITLTAGDFAL